MKQNEVYSMAKGVCLVRQGRLKRLFLWDPRKKCWVSDSNKDVSLRRVGKHSWQVLAPTISSSQVIIVSGPKSKDNRSSAFRLAAVHACKKQQIPKA